MEKTKKIHAKDYLLDLASKKSAPQWLVSLIQTVIGTNGEISPEQKESIYSTFLDENELRKSVEGSASQQKSSPTSVAEKTSSAVVSSEAPLAKLELVKHKHGVNALLIDQQLDFHPECTLVFGLNGSGKSGYFRIIHELAGGETPREIIGNVYTPAESEFDVEIVWLMLAKNFLISHFSA